MRSLICVAIIVAVAGLAGCAKQESAPPEAPSVQADQPPEATPISSEDFESGEAEGAVQGGEEADEDAPADAPHGETP